MHTYKHVGTHLYEWVRAHAHTHVRTQTQVMDFRFPVKSVIIGQFCSSSGMLLEWLRHKAMASQISSQHANDKSGEF